MKLYRRTEKDLPKATSRCYFDADQGRTALALQRIQDINEEHPGNPHIVYAEGLIRKYFLGEGIKSRDLFERAYHLATSSVETRSLAARNALHFSRTKEEWATWVTRDREVDPSDRGFQDNI